MNGKIFLKTISLVILIIYFITTNAYAKIVLPLQTEVYKLDENLGIPYLEGKCGNRLFIINSEQDSTISKEERNNPNSLLIDLANTTKTSKNIEGMKIIYFLNQYPVSVIAYLVNEKEWFVLKFDENDKIIITNSCGEPVPPENYDAEIIIASLLKNNPLVFTQDNLLGQNPEELKNIIAILGTGGPSFTGAFILAAVFGGLLLAVISGKVTPKDIKDIIDTISKSLDNLVKTIKNIGI